MATGSLYRMVQLQLMASPLVLQPQSLHKAAETVTPLLNLLLTFLTLTEGMAVEEEAVEMDQEEVAIKEGPYVLLLTRKMGRVAICIPVLSCASWAATLVTDLLAFD